MRGSASLVVGLLASISATLRASHLPVRIYTTADGLAANTVNRIVRDSRGFLWFCTREGLSRFDGYQFTNFGTEQGLPVSDNFLLETRRGGYWVATDYGIARFNPANSKPVFTLYRPRDPKARMVNVLVEDSNGDIWCGTTAGLYRLEQVKEDSHSGEVGQWRLRFVDIGLPQQTDDDMVVEALLQDRSGALWIGGPSGLYRRLADGRSERYTSRNGLPSPHILSLLQDRGGRLWAGTWGGLCRLSSNGRASALVERVYTVRDGLAANVVGTLLESSDGQLWIGTDNGLSAYHEGALDTFKNFTTANGLSENNIYSLAEDRAGNLWAGSVGVNRISRNGFLGYGTQDGLASSCINAIGEDLKGELCVFVTALNNIHVKCTFLNRFDGSRFHSVLPNVPSTIKNWGWGSHQFQDSRGEWWVPTGQGLFRFPALANPAELRYARPEAVYGAWNGLAGENIYRLFEDSRGDIWIATASASRNGLSRWERATNTLRQFSSSDGLPPERLVNAFAEDRSGCIWVGFYLGDIARFRGGHFEFFKAGEALSFRAVRALHLDDAGRIWVASEGGLTRIDSPTDATPRFTIYTTTQGLSSNNVQCIVQDRYGRIYVGTDSGVDCFYPRTPLCIKHYTTADGLVLGRGMTSFRDHQGTLWFGTEAGLSRLKPEPERPRVAPPIFITSFRVRGVPQPISPLGETNLAGFRFAPEQNQIEIEFVGLEFGAGNSLRYQYQLTGAGADQSTPTDQRRINYAGLSPGSYHFLVRAVTSDGLFSAKPATVGFTNSRSCLAAPVVPHLGCAPGGCVYFCALPLPRVAPSRNGTAADSNRHRTAR